MTTTPPIAAGSGGPGRLRRIARRATLALAGVSLAVLAVLGACAGALSGDATETVLELRGTLGEVRTAAAWADAQSQFRHLVLHNHRGEAVVEALLRRPRRLRPDHRVLLTYTGTGTGARIFELIPARDDLVLLAVQYPFARPEGGWERLRAAFHVRRAALRTAAGGLLAVDYLERDEALDPGRVLLLGASVGSIFATLQGALDERIPRVLIVHGGGDLPTLLRVSMRGSFPDWLLPAAVRLARIPTDSFDPVRYVGRIAPRELVVVAARQDRSFPAASVEAFYARAGEPKRLLWTDTGHVGNSKAEIVAVVAEQITAYLEAELPALQAGG
jgi:hypothetical protein